jgi:hypothetical protein
MWCRVAFVRTDVSVERIASIIRVERISELGTVLQLLVTVNVVPSSLIISTVMMETTRSSETSVLTRVTRRHIPEDGTLQYTSHSENNTECYEIPTGISY